MCPKNKWKQRSGCHLGPGPEPNPDPEKWQKSTGTGPGPGPSSSLALESIVIYSNTNAYFSHEHVLKIIPHIFVGILVTVQPMLVCKLFLHDETPYCQCWNFTTLYFLFFLSKYYWKFTNVWGCRKMDGGCAYAPKKSSITEVPAIITYWLLFTNFQNWTDKQLCQRQCKVVVDLQKIETTSHKHKPKNKIAEC